VPVDSLVKPDGRSYSLAEQAGALAVVLREEFGVDFALYDVATGELVEAERVSAWEGAPPEPRSGLSKKTWLAAAVLDPAGVRDLAAEGRARALPLARGGYQIALVLHRSNRPVLVAASGLAALARTEAEAAREQAMLQHWLQAVSDRLRLSDQLVVRRRQDEDRQGQAAAPWEALLTVDQVARRLRISRQPEKCVQRILEGACGLLGVQTLAWIPQHPDHPVVFQGKVLLAPADCRQLAAVLAKSPDFRAPGPLLCDEFQARSGAARFPTVCNVMAFQVADQVPVGWVLAINKEVSGGVVSGEESSAPHHSPLTTHHTPFRKSDAALLTPFVALLEMYLRSANRYQDLKDLLVGLTRALTTALDAKDSYTFGHSERVARIAVELGREMGLEGDELGDIYLAGLLHDVGKIGIRDTVLLKPDTLTAEEREHIKQHVTIGYSILADLRQIRNLLPGVLYHHERYDGAGYPDGLAGESIPLLARILAVADAYDAMSNARPYRDAFPCRKVEEILSQGMGTQWDAQVVEAFMRCRQKIHTIRQRGVGDSLRLAIEGTLRSDTALLNRLTNSGL
jgi:HD-GYP domain-containing protein (c-di-GMP phosphodiesterase class II)